MWMTVDRVDRMTWSDLTSTSASILPTTNIVITDLLQLWLKVKLDCGYWSLIPAGGSEDQRIWDESWLTIVGRNRPPAAWDGMGLSSRWTRLRWECTEWKVNFKQTKTSPHQQLMILIYYISEIIQWHHFTSMMPWLTDIVNWPIFV